MASSLQEKFQISAKRNDKGEDPGPWVSDKAARAGGNVAAWVADNAGEVDARRFNMMPPGMDIGQERAEINKMPLSTAGETDVSKDTNPTAFAEGFTKRDMKGTDDQYTGEHMDHFYGDAGGFVERNNYLDRE